MHPVFQKLSSQHTCQLIFENSNKIKVKSGSFLYTSGDEKLSFYIVMSGWLHIVDVGQFSTGSIVGEEWLFDKKYSNRKQSAYCPSL